MTQAAAFLFLILMAGLCLFQIALAAGAPLGRLAWGGAAARLPPSLRMASLIAVVIYGACVVIILDRAGVIEATPEPVSATGAGVIAVLLSLGVVMNALSRSAPERFIMTPVALILSACAWRVATG